MASILGICFRKASLGGGVDVMKPHALYLCFQNTFSQSFTNGGVSVLETFMTWELFLKSCIFQISYVKTGYLKIRIFPIPMEIFF